MSGEEIREESIMNTREEILSQVYSAFPHQFDFYHLGKVEQYSNANVSSDDCIAVAFKLYGDMSALVILAFSIELDISTYSELVNILVSKIANQLGSRSGIGVMVTPPKILEHTQFKRLLNHNGPIFRRTYAHFNQKSVIPLETWVLPTSAEGIGYA